MSATALVRDVDRTVGRPMRRSLVRVLSTGSTFALSMAPHGGQRTARRNALAAVLADEVAARARAEAHAAADAATAATIARHLAGVPAQVG